MGISAKSIPTGIEELDKYLNGGIRAGVTVIAAKPSTGKTTITLAIAENLSKLGNQVIYFCNDMSKEEIVAKGLSRTSYILAEEKGFSTTDVCNIRAWFEILSIISRYL
jgi:replicative DNA helicase